MYNKQQENMCIIKFGTWLEAVINVITFGHGKDIAGYIAGKLGYTDCGCDRRREYLDNLFGCKNGVKL
jgi:hypothetical protein